MDPFMSKKNINMTIFTDCSIWSGIFSLPESQCFYSLVCLFRLGFIVAVKEKWPYLQKNVLVCAWHAKPFVKTFFTETCFCVHFTYSSINFAWFALLKQQKFDDRPLFKTGALLDLCPMWKQIFMRLKIFFAINQFQTVQSLHLFKKKSFFIHFQKIILIDWVTLVYYLY